MTLSRLEKAGGNSLDDANALLVSAERRLANATMAALSQASPAELALVTQILKEWGADPAIAADKIAAAMRWTPAALDTYSVSVAGHLVRATKATAAAERVRVARIVGGAFNIENPYAIAFARQRSSALVVDITTSMRGALRRIIADAYRKGQDWRVAAQLIRQAGIGLTNYQAGRVAVFADKLRERGLTESQVWKEQGRMVARLKRQRSEVIAQTEINRAANEGIMQTWDAGLKSGVIAADSKKRWITRWPCPICAPLHNAEAPIRGTFPGGYQAPPIHPRCKCAIALVVNAPGKLSPKAQAIRALLQ